MASTAADAAADADCALRAGAQCLGLACALSSRAAANARHGATTDHDDVRSQRSNNEFRLSAKASNSDTRTCLALSNLDTAATYRL
jgi:hypothetical protein